MNWYGLNWTDILLGTAILAIIPSAFAVYGGYLAAEPIPNPRRRNIKLLFWGLFVVSVVLAFLQQFRAAQVDLEKDTKGEWSEAMMRSTFPPPRVPPVQQLMPSPPKPKLWFSFVPLGPHEQPIDTVSRPVVNGVVTVALTAKDVGTAQANNGQIWIQLCDACKFAEEPEGSTAPPGDANVRRKRFDTLHRGSYFDATTLKIVPPVGISSFTIDLKYACERCPPIDNDHPQKLKVNVTAP